MYETNADKIKYA